MSGHTSDKLPTSRCMVDKIDYLFCPCEPLYRVCYEFEDGSVVRLSLCSNHFAQMWSIAEYLAAKTGAVVVSAKSSHLPSKAKAKRAKSGKA